MKEGRGWGSIVRKAQKRTRTNPSVTLSLSGSPVSRTVDKAWPVCRCSAACERVDCTSAPRRAGTVQRLQHNAALPGRNELNVCESTVRNIIC